MDKKVYGKKHLPVGKVLECILLCVIFLVFIFPFYWMVITSLKSTLEAASSAIVWFPEKLMWSNYIDAWNEVNFIKYGKNSILLSVACLITCI